MKFLGLIFCLHACVFVSILLGHAYGKTLIVQEGGQAVLETPNLGNNTHQWTWSKGRKSVSINVQDSHPQDTLQSVFPNCFWDPQTGHLILKPVNAEDLGFWKCEQEVISWEGGSKVTKIEETAYFLDVSQRTTIRTLVPEWSQGRLRCQSSGGNPKVAMRGVVSTDPSGNEVIRELPLLNPTKNVAFGTAETVFQFDPDRLDLKKPFLVCIGSQFQNGSLEFQTLDSYPPGQLQMQHPQGDATKIITFSNEVNEMRFHWLWLLLIVVVASVVILAIAVGMVNHWRSKKHNPTETADEESSGTSVCPSYVTLSDFPYECSNGSEHYYERIKNEDLLEPMWRLQLLPTDE